MTELREAGEITTGEVLEGRYRLEERIGEGGMARVFRAEDTVLGRTVAVKILRAPVDGLSGLERARSETLLLASLNHHGLVTLFDARISEDQTSYLVMEYVEGMTLRDLIGQGPLDSAEAASLTIDIAEALHAAHAAGIVHRDIKPSNVLLWRSPLPGREWRAKIADFGIAYLLDSSRITTPGLMVGTVAYIAPEQARGVEPAPAADVYALGLVIIEALTGTRPFADAEGIGTVMARLQSSPTVPESLEEGWQHLLRWMTAVSPEDRPTALEVAVAASRLSPVALPAHADEETAAALPLAVPGLATAPPATALSAMAPTAPPPPSTALAATTGATAIFPAAAVAGTVAAGAGAIDAGVIPAPPPLPASPDAATLVAPLPPATGDRSDDVAGGPGRRRRRAIVAAVVLGALILVLLIGGGIWAATSMLGVPEPAPSQPVEEQVTDPVVEDVPVVEEPTPVDDPVDNSNSGSGNSNGNGNDNSGPGNSNGNGKGKGKGRG